MEVFVMRTLRIGVGISSVLLVLAATVSPTQAAAPKPGTACKTLGQKIVSGKLTYTCTKSGSKLIWSKGYKLPLRVITKTFPAAISGRAYRAAIEVTGGTGYHFCNLQKGSGLPPGYSLNPKTCIITGVGEVLPAGTTKRVSPPFVILVTDSAKPKPTTIRLTTSIITYPPPAILTINPNPVPCVVGKNCYSLIATVSGLNPPYTFGLGTGGFPPLGLFLNQNGDSAYITGLARVEDPNHEFEICASDIGGRAVCKKAQITVQPATTFVVTVAKAGDGQGTVLADSGKINCGDVCQDNYVEGVEVNLDFKANPGSVFTGWSGDCTGTGRCTLNVDGAKTVTATFATNASGTYSGIATMPNLNVPGFTGCEGGPRSKSLTIKESEGGQITGMADIPFAGTRVGSVITVTATTTSLGSRGPYVWNWDGINLSGSLPWFCLKTSTQEVLNESTYTFSYKRS